MPIVEKSLVEGLERSESLQVEGIDVSGDWNTFIASRVHTDLDLSIVDWVRGQPQGATIDRCWQCGTCTAGCCMHTDYGLEEFNPRYFIYLAQLGYDKELARYAQTVWRCVSCNKCVERCPKGVKVEEVVHSIGTYLELTGTAPKSPADRFDEAYTRNLLARGILDEAGLFQTFEAGEGRTLPTGEKLRMGLRLLLTGRLHTGPLAKRTRGWGRLRPVLERMLSEDLARRRQDLPARLPPKGGP